MPEVRIDPLTGQRTIVASDRATRPGGGLSATPSEPIDEEKDPFLEGHEDRTPPETYAVRQNGSQPDSPGWAVRVVPNLYPALDPESSEPAPFAKPELFTASPARGAHEVVINAPQPVTSLAHLQVQQVRAAVEVWRQRMRTHFADGAAYVHVIVNERREAGASLPHTHAQIYALGFVPAAVARERERFGAYAQRTMGANLLQDLVQEEVKLGQRIVAIDDLIARAASEVPAVLCAETLWWHCHRMLVADGRLVQLGDVPHPDDEPVQSPRKHRRGQHAPRATDRAALQHARQQLCGDACIPREPGAVVEHRAGRMVAVTITLSEWLFNAVLSVVGALVGFLLLRRGDITRKVAYAMLVTRPGLEQAPIVPLGQFQQPMARRNTVSGNVVSPCAV